nr:hypothetical protein [Tanacetum cinerariifolium]
MTKLARNVNLPIGTKTSLAIPAVGNKNQSISKSDVDLKLLEHLPKFVDLDFIFFLLFLIEHPLRIRDIGVKRIRLMHNNFFKTEAWIFGQEEVGP